MSGQERLTIPNSNLGLREKVKRIVAITSLSLSLGTGGALVSEVEKPDIAEAAETGGYDGANLRCIHAPYAISGPANYCQNYDWGTITKNEKGYDYSKSTTSPRGYGWRNCTDWVAFKIQSYLGYSPRGLGNGNEWDDRAAGQGFRTTNQPEAGHAAVWNGGSYGHVAFVESVNKDGTVNVSEYNRGMNGTYGTRNNVKADVYVDFDGPGVNKYTGSTVTSDTDNDGFADNVDKCPKIAGSIEGCPEGQPLVSVVPNYLGGNSAYMRGNDGRLYTSWQTGYGTIWEGWVPIGANKITGAPTVINLSNGTHAIFVRGENNQALTVFQTEAGGQWYWADLGGALTSNIVVEDAITGGKVIFAKDNRGELVHKWQNAPGGAWSEWNSLGGSLLGDPNVLRTPDGRHVVYARGTNGHLMTKWQQSVGGSWSPWTDLGGELTSSPVAQWMNNGAMVVFARDSQGRITHKWQLAPESGQWSEWVPLTNKTLSGPAVVKESDGRFSIYYADEGGILNTDWQTSPGSTWLRGSLGAAIVGTPEIERSATGVLSEFAPNHNGVVTTKWQTAPQSAWAGPEVVGQVIYPAW